MKITLVFSIQRTLKVECTLNAKLHRASEVLCFATKDSLVNGSNTCFSHADDVDTNYVYTGLVCM